MNGPKQLILLIAVQGFALALALCDAAVAPQPGSASPTPSATAGGDCFAPMFSANGRWVVFLSGANNLVANDDLAPNLDVFVHDLNTSNTVLVSVNLSGIGGGNASSHSPSISSNGQFIAFESAADNLLAGDTNGSADVFVRDVAGGTTTLVSVDNPGTGGANGASSNPLISHDGRWVVFESEATNMVAGDTNGVADVFARDRMNGVTLMVSDGATSAGPGVGPSGSPHISADGRFVVFSKVTSNAMPAFGTTSHGEVYLWDEQTATTTWVTTNMASQFTGASNGFSCFNPVVSTNGRFVAFLAAERYATGARLYRRDLLLETNVLVLTNVPLRYVPQMSSNGRFIAASGNHFSTVGLHVWDGTEGRTWTLCFDFGAGEYCGESPVMAANGAAMAYVWPLNGVSVATAPVWVASTVSRSTNGSVRRVANLSEPAISADGQRVAFETAERDLVANDLNLASDIFVRDLQSSTTRLVSRRHANLPSFTAAGQMSLDAPTLSADGRVVAFTGGDNTLLPFDTNGVTDVLVTDQVSGSNYLAGAGYFVAHLDGGSLTNFFLPKLPTYKPVLSADGRFIAFERTEVGPGGSYTARNVYRQDLGDGTWKLVNRTQPFAPFPADGAGPAMTSDGRFVAFQSYGRAGDLDGLFTVDLFTSLDVFVRDMAASNILTRTVSLSTNGQAGTGQSINPVFSPAGQWIAFQSDSRFLVTNSILGGYQLFARNLATSRTRLVSFKPDGSGQAPGYGNASPVFSADSRYVFFQETNIASATAVYRHDLAGVVRVTNDVVCTNCAAPSTSAAGRWVAYVTRGTATLSQVFVQDMQTGNASLISSNATGTGGNGPSFAPQISHDARYVVYASRAGDLVGNDNNGLTDVFVHDRWAGTTLLASLNAQGTASGNGPSSSPVLAADGRTVAFLSYASDLLPGDFNDKRDVFVLRLGGADTDSDGMEDDWEMAYFSTLVRDGNGDFDGDGSSDIDEFRAGTDPLDTGSVFRVLILSAPLNGNKTLLWSAAPGRTYRVEFKNNIGDTDWTVLIRSVTAIGTTAVKQDPGAASEAHRFYRVLLVP